MLYFQAQGVPPGFSPTPDGGPPLLIVNGDEWSGLYPVAGYSDDRGPYLYTALDTTGVRYYFSPVDTSVENSDGVAAWHQPQVTIPVSDYEKYTVTHGQQGNPHHFYMWFTITPPADAGVWHAGDPGNSDWGGVDYFVMSAPPVVTPTGITEETEGQSNWTSSLRPIVKFVAEAVTLYAGVSAAASAGGGAAAGSSADVIAPAEAGTSTAGLSASEISDITAATSDGVGGTALTAANALPDATPVTTEIAPAEAGTSTAGMSAEEQTALIGATSGGSGISIADAVSAVKQGAAAASAVKTVQSALVPKSAPQTGYVLTALSPPPPPSDASIPWLTLIGIAISLLNS